MCIGTSLEYRMLDAYDNNLRGQFSPMRFSQKIYFSLHIYNAYLLHVPGCRVSKSPLRRYMYVSRLVLPFLTNIVIDVFNIEYLLNITDSIGR